MNAEFRWIVAMALNTIVPMSVLQDGHEEIFQLGRVWFRHFFTVRIDEDLFE